MRTLSGRRAVLALVAAFLAAGSASATGPGTPVPERAPARVTAQVAQHRLTFEGERYNLPLGAYALEVAALTRDAGERRLVEGLKITFQPGPAWHRARTRFLRSAILEPDPTVATRFVLESIELKENGRTLAVVAHGKEIERGITRLSLAVPDGATVGTIFEPATWAMTEVVLHARFLAPESPSLALPNIPDEGRLSWTYRPARTTLVAGPAMAPGRPLAPGRLVPIGSGLSVFPERPYAGDTFTASIILLNRGERATAEESARWNYGRLALQARIPALEPGRDTTLAFTAAAGRGEDRVTISWKDTMVSALVSPLLRPRIVLGAAAVDSGYREDALVVRVAIGNRGTGEAGAARLRIVAADRDTLIALPAIPPDETRVVVAVFAESGWPETFPVTAGVTAEFENADTRRMLIVRPARPAPAIALAAIAIEGEQVPGAAGRAAAVFTNNGNQHGAVRARILVRAIPTGIEIERATREERIPPGGEVAIPTPLFPWATGLTRIEVSWEAGATSGEDFRQVYAAPHAFLAPDGETVLAIASTDPAGIQPAGGQPGGSTPAEGSYATPRRLETVRTFQLPPLGNLDELSANARLVVSSACWLTNPAGTEFLPAGAAARREARSAIRATLTGAGYTDAFSIAASETRFVFAIPRSALAETLTLSLASASRSPVFLTAAPSLRIGWATPERGSFTDLSVSETSLALVVANTARWTPARVVTIAAAYAEPVPASGGPVRFETAVPLAPGEMRRVTIPLPPAPPGRHQLEVSVPLSSTPTVQRIEQLVLPTPRPALAPARALAARSLSGETGLVAILGIQGNAVRDLILAAHEANAAERLSVPAQETAVAWLPGARTMSIDYGPLSARRTVEQAPPAEFRDLRILDTGGDTPARGQFFLLRFARGGAEPRPEGRVHLAINGLLRATRQVPATESGAAWIDGFVLAPGPGGSVEAVLFEEDVSGGVRIDRRVFPVAAEPVGASRVERDWTRPVMVSPAALGSRTTNARGDTRGAAAPPAGGSHPADTRSSPSERAALAAWEVAAFLVQRDRATFGTITPEPARALARLGSDTSALGRMAYRRQLWELVEQWERAARRLEMEPLASTLSIERFRAFQASIAALKQFASEVGILNRRAVLDELDRLAGHVPHILGRDVDPALAAAIIGPRPGAQIRR